MNKTYTSSVHTREAKPRSKRLRELGYSGATAIPQTGLSLTLEELSGLRSLISWFGIDENGAVFVKKDENDNARDFYSFGEVTAGGIGHGGEGGGGALYALSDIYGDTANAYVKRADGTRATAGDAIVYDSTLQKWVASPVQASGGVTSFNSRTGAVSLLASDVTGALGYTPYNSSNPSGYITASALNGYATQAWVNQQGYALASSLGNYQPLATAINTGNIASQSVAYASNAGQLNSLSAANYITENSSANLQAAAVVSGNICGFGYSAYGWPTSGAFISFGGFGNHGYVTQIQGYYGGGALYFRTINDDGVSHPSQWYGLYHSGNCDNTSTPWACSDLTASGRIIAAGHFSNDNGRYGLWAMSDYGSYGYGLFTYLPYDRGQDQGAFRISSSYDYWQGTGPAGIISIHRSTAGVGYGSNPSSLSYASIGYITGTGNLIMVGEVTAGSDARWKHNITPVVNGINAIMRLKPSEWDWNSDNHRGSGLIAQDVQTVLPHLVKADGEGFLHLTYDGLHAYEISALQSHETRIQQLERENAELKRMLNINS